MARLGKNVKEKRADQVARYLSQWLENGEEILAIFNANRQNPQISGLILTNHRMILVKGSGGRVNYVNEIGSDEIQEFTSVKGLGKIIKLFITKKDGAKVYVCMMTQEDILAANSFIPKMSGNPLPLNKEVLANDRNKVHNQKDKNSNTVGTLIFLIIIGIILLFIFPPLALPFLVGGLVAFSLRRKKRNDS